MADGVLNAGVNLEAFAQAIAAIQALRSSVTRVFDCLKDGKRNKETLEGREKSFVTTFQESLHSVSRDLGELERLSNLVGKPSENHPSHNSGLHESRSWPRDKAPSTVQLLPGHHKWSNKTFTSPGTLEGLMGAVFPWWLPGSQHPALLTSR
ncbi:mediator of RNA polymerase II transcription subunit 27-like isoform X2 [Sphaerodactylus townsendi]|uniref:mediator of RNA polymerase II transcription subunit 27-like isoform X2 n=1 Tax=Sphaerodactylus townsendi TaxID=933632 RepID=UPI002026EB87|nr:mediator of RNA polymerase II transcription subunit 27-like isoform X2 [Sphaerodactylus townsendi]